MYSPAFIINRESYTVRKNGSLLAKLAERQNIPHLFLQDFNGLDAQLDALRDRQAGHIFIEGGDGTIQSVLSAFLQTGGSGAELPAFSLLAGGRTNLIARHLGIVNNMDARLSALLAQPELGLALNSPMLGLETDQKPSALYGFLLSTGAMPAATQFCHDKVHTTGLSGGAAIRSTLFRVLFGQGPDRAAILKPTDLDLQIENTHISEPHLLLLASTLPWLMSGLHPFWGDGDGPLNISLATGKARHYGRNLLRIMKKNKSEMNKKALKNNGFYSWSVNKARIRVKSSLVLDGEFLPLQGQDISLFASPPLRFIK